MVRLKEKYRSEVVQKLEKEFEYGNVNAIPRLMKININITAAHQINRPLNTAVLTTYINHS